MRYFLFYGALLFLLTACEGLYQTGMAILSEPSVNQETETSALETPVKKPPMKQKVRLRTTLFFQAKAAKILPKEAALLKDFVDALEAYDSIIQIRVIGSQNAEQQNAYLPQKRTQRIAQFLVDAGVDANLIEVIIDPISTVTKEGKPQIIEKSCADKASLSNAQGCVDLIAEALENSTATP